MAFDAFMHIDGIQGESSDERHAGWIEIKNFSLGVGQRVSRTASSADGEFPIDDVAVNYGQIEWHYTRQNRAGGGAIGSLAAAWSLEKNCKA